MLTKELKAKLLTNEVIAQLKEQGAKIAKLSKINNDLESIFNTLESEQLRDLLGVFDFKRELHKIGH